MKILTKTAFVKEQIIDKIQKGSKSFEIHSTEENITNLYKNIGKYLNLIRDLDIDIQAMHSPITAGFNLEDLITNFSQIEKVFFLTNEIGKLQNRVIPVILHFDFNLAVFNRFSVTKDIVTKLNNLLNIYEKTNVVIENLMLIALSDGKMGVRTNYDISAAEFAEYFNANTGKNIGTVLDTAHMLSTIRLIEKFKKDFPDDIPLEIEYYIKNFIKTLQIVHLSYSKNNGIKRGEHGIAFKTEKEILVMEKIVKLLNNYGFDGFITFEVEEDNYHDTKNWVTTRDNLYKVAEKLKIKDKIS